MDMLTVEKIKSVKNIDLSWQNNVLGSMMSRIRKSIILVFYCFLMASKIPIIGGIGAAAAGVLFILFFTPLGISKEDYSLSVDPTKEKES